MFKEKSRQEYNLSISGGDEKKKYYISAGYLNDNGIVDASDFLRYTSRVNVEQEVTDWFKAGATLSYVRTQMDYQNYSSTAGANMFYLTNNMAPIYTIWERDTNGNIIYEDNGDPVYSFDRPFAGNSNPIASQKLDIYRRIADVVGAKGFGEIKFLKDFKFKLNLGIDNYNSDLTRYNNNKYGQYADQNGYTYRYKYNMTAITAAELLTWERQFGQHNIDVLAGHESYKYNDNDLSGSKNNFLLPGINIELDGAISNPTTGSSKNEYATEGYLSRVQYNYDEKYFVSTSFRRDASSVFHPNNRWGNFWSVGGAWKLDREVFMQPIDWINSLKLKASYGSQGNDALLYSGTLSRNYYPYTDQYEVVNNGGQLATEKTYIGNPELKWEENHNFNAGFEFVILDKRLSGGIEYFQRTAKDLLFPVPVPTSSGYISIPKNVGDMRNRGIEIELSSDIVRTNDFNFNLSLNATTFDNEITKLPEENREKGIINSIYRWTEGKSIYNLYMAKYAGVNPETGASRWYVKDQETGDIARDKNTGELLTSEAYNSDNRFDIDRRTIPDLYGGVTFDFSYKGIDLVINTSYQIGGLVYDVQYSTLMEDGGGGTNWHKDMLNRWTPDNPGANTPRVTLDYLDQTAVSDRFLINASYFSLNNITLGYNFPSKLTKKLYLSSLRVYGAADNVYLFSKRQGLDPRQVVAGRLPDSAYSPIRTISMGINVSF